MLAEDEGFEPPQTESESGVLPLHKSSIWNDFIICNSFQKSRLDCKKSEKHFFVILNTQKQAFGKKTDDKERILIKLLVLTKSKRFQLDNETKIVYY